MKDRIVFILYVSAVILITIIHDINFLLAGLGVVILLSGRNFWRIVKKVAIAIAIFNSIVTISYCIISTIKGNFSTHYVMLINLRVFLLTSMTFMIREWINPFKALGFSRSMLYLVTLAYSQVLTLRRLFEEFQLALKSRSVNRLTVRNLFLHSASISTFFLQKSFNDASEITQAMKSRGFFNDQG